LVIAQKNSEASHAAKSITAEEFLADLRRERAVNRDPGATSISAGNFIKVDGSDVLAWIQLNNLNRASLVVYRYDRRGSREWSRVNHSTNPLQVTLAPEGGVIMAVEDLPEGCEAFVLIAPHDDDVTLKTTFVRVSCPEKFRVPLALKQMYALRVIVFGPHGLLPESRVANFFTVVSRQTAPRLKKNNPNNAALLVQQQEVAAVVDDDAVEELEQIPVVATKKRPRPTDDDSVSSSASSIPLSQGSCFSNSNACDDDARPSKRAHVADEDVSDILAGRCNNLFAHQAWMEPTTSASSSSSSSSAEDPSTDASSVVEPPMNLAEAQFQAMVNMGIPPSELDPYVDPHMILLEELQDEYSFDSFPSIDEL
jgi:hypothetical protein